MRIVTYLLLFIVIFLGITFAALNSETVTVHYYLGEKALPLSFFLVGIFAAGCMVGLLVGISFYLKSKIKIYRLQQQLKVAEKEVQNLRAIPLQDRH